jgi:hypothetical protein
VRDNLRLLTPQRQASPYTFNQHVIKHRFCAVCGIHPFAEGAAFSSPPVKHFDGRSL